MKKRIAIAALAVAGMASSALALSDVDSQGDGFRAAVLHGIGPFVVGEDVEAMLPVNSWPTLILWEYAPIVAA